MFLHKTWFKLSSDTMSLLQSQIFFVESVDAVNHLLHELHLRVAQPVLVRDVVGDASLATRLSPGTARLEVEFLTAGSQLLEAQLGPAGQVNVDGSSHSCPQVGGAAVDVAVLLVLHEVLPG